MALTTKDEVADEPTGNSPSFLSMMMYAIRPDILKTILGEVHENLAAGLPTDKTGGRQEIRLQKG